MTIMGILKFGMIFVIAMSLSPKTTTTAFLPFSSYQGKSATRLNNSFRQQRQHHLSESLSSVSSVPLSSLSMSGKGGGRGTPAKPADSEEEDMELTRQAVTSFIQASQQLDTSLHDALDYRQHHSSSVWTKCQDYLALIRWFTLIQAVGAFVVGCLVTSTKPTVSSLLSVYLSYGVGMAVNDCVDHTIDSKQKALPSKRNRPIASGRISVSEGWAFVTLLTAISLGLAVTQENNMVAATVAAAASTTTNKFGLWTASNLFVMFAYAMGLQKILFLKNLIVGYLGISPLLGAVFLSTAATTAASSATAATSTVISKLYRLASVGMSVGVAREILKDIEDVDIDKEGGKSTLPIVVGPKPSHRIAFGMVWATCMAMLTKGFRSMFACASSGTPPFYMISWFIGTGMITRATFLPLSKGQKLLKNSIYILLGGMTLGLIAK